MVYHKDNVMLTIRNRVTIPITKDNIKADFISFNGIDDNNEHLLIEIRNASGEMPSCPILRIHSECLTGDVFHSQRCDCGPQLNEAILKIHQYGGYIAYLRQEGRGIGLYNKIDAYVLQDTGLNTYQANNALGFGDDLRNFSIVSEMLDCLNIKAVFLLTNNPEKVTQLEKSGVQVLKQLHTTKFVTAHNAEYLSAKQYFGSHRFS